MNPRKFYRTVIHVEVLSEKPLPDGVELESVADAITTGDCSGRVTWDAEEILTGAQAAEALRVQGSDAAFFGLTDAGDEIEDEEEEDEA